MITLGVTRSQSFQTWQQNDSIKQKNPDLFRNANKNLIFSIVAKFIEAGETSLKRQGFHPRLKLLKRKVKFQKVKRDDLKKRGKPNISRGKIHQQKFHPWNEENL